MTGRAKRPPPAKRPAAKKAPVKKRPAKAAAKASKRWVGHRQPFGRRGARLWAALHEEVIGESGLVLLEESCRIADRLDKLDELLKGDADVWARLVHDARTDSYELKIDSALIEARQQANVLRQLIAGLPLKEAGGDEEQEGWVDSL
jgi:hypothetical protein